MMDGKFFFFIVILIFFFLSLSWDFCCLMSLPFLEVQVVPAAATSSLVSLAQSSVVHPPWVAWPVKPAACARVLVVAASASRHRVQSGLWT
jgi:hypothetical protein